MVKNSSGQLKELPVTAKNVGRTLERFCILYDCNIFLEYARFMFR